MKKHSIDKIFREKFRDYGELPDNKVWKSIEASLDRKKQDRRIIPIWWKYAGVAALLAILFLLVQPFPMEKGGNIQVTDSGTTDSPADVDKKNMDQPIRNGGGDEHTTAVSARDEQKDSGNDRDPGTTTPENDAVSGSVVSAGNAADDKTSGERLSREQATSPAALADRVTQRDRQARENSNKGQKEAVIPAATDADKAVLAATEQNDVMEPDTGITEGRNKTMDRVADGPAEIAGTDSGKPNTQKDKKSILDAIREQEDEPVAENAAHHWSIGPRVAPVYFNSFGEGSPIHPNFVANSKSGNINLSYGLSIAYEVSPKLSVRSGVNKVDYGYDTNDILFTSSLAASTNKKINNIDYALTSKNLVVQSNTNGDPPQAILSSGIEVAAPTPARNGRMVQQFGYVEIPLELNYAFLESRLGFNLIGGVSSLFLIDNAVTLESNGGATEIGEANNINSLNFSTNIGFGLNYRLSEKLQVNMEPMFKYQLNTFSDAAGNFQPFSIGLYSGLSFKF